MILLPSLLPSQNDSHLDRRSTHLTSDPSLNLIMGLGYFGELGGFNLRLTQDYFTHEWKRTDSDAAGNQT